MNKYSFVALAATVALPGMAMAEVSGSIDLAYSVFDSTDYDDNVTSPSLKANLSYGGEMGILLDLSAGTKRYSLDGDDLDLNEANIDLGYAFGNGFNAGIFAESFSFGFDVTSRGVFAGYDAGNFAGEAYFGSMDLPFGDEIDQFGFRGTYSLGATPISQLSLRALKRMTSLTRLITSASRSATSLTTHLEYSVRFSVSAVTSMKI